MEKTNLVAVYGSLRKGFGNWQWYLDNEHSEYLGTERIKQHGMVSLGGFPAVFTDESDNNGIVIEIYKVTDDVFQQLDGLEGYPNFYDRKKVDTSFGKAWMYTIEAYREQPRDRVTSGDWSEFVSNSKVF